LKKFSRERESVDVLYNAFLAIAGGVIGEEKDDGHIDFKR
jgi:hypothetical protein